MAVSPEPSDDDALELPVEPATIPGDAAPLEFVIAPEQAGARLDYFLAQQLTAYSRVHLRKVINASAVSVNAKRTKASYHVQAGDRVTLTLPDLPRDGPQPEAMELTILYEDECMVAINKPPHMVVHPGKGHWSGTLTAGLQYHFNQLSSIGGASRPGIVHRLDRDTSGVLVVAKNDRAHLALAAQFEARTVEKEYFAITAGVPDWDRDLIDLPIGLHPHHREKMAIRRHGSDSRPAQTFYEVLERFQGFAALKLTPKTGRTHQIRVHLATLNCPVLCDRLYGGRGEITRGELRRGPPDGDVVLSRQALHAVRLKVAHPKSGEPLEFRSPLPADIAATLAILRG